MTLADPLNWLTQHAALCNLVATVVILVVGVYLRFAMRSVFKDRPFLRDAFIFWFLQWATFLFVYLFLDYLMGPGRVWLLVVIDLQSIFAVGFFCVFLYGASHKIGSVLEALLIIFVTFMFIDLVLGYKAVGQPAESNWHYAWIAPSEVLSVTALVMMGGVFVLRYGAIALPLLIANGIYAALQRPIYAGLFISQKPQPEWLLAVAVGKLVIGSLFYLYFFVPLEKYESLKLPPADTEVVQTVKGHLRWFWSAAGGGGAILLFILREWIRKTFFQ